ncbi:hypothetical protein PHMEG_0001768 [Phytophthora megakarya]|uniref:Uncharacterized protein n=1 Tax=Phytophthora megakarya TaxID=4795 RepID=A0A225X2E4_9STRA|nr:hypothetical protein PHMEG_0001768 [Phytophthora megakarya]
MPGCCCWLSAIAPSTIRRQHRPVVLTPSWSQAQRSKSPRRAAESTELSRSNPCLRVYC